MISMTTVFKYFLLPRVDLWQKKNAVVVFLRKTKKVISPEMYTDDGIVTFSFVFFFVYFVAYRFTWTTCFSSSKGDASN